MAGALKTCWLVALLSHLGFGIWALAQYRPRPALPACGTTPVLAAASTPQPCRSWPRV